MITDYAKYRGTCKEVCENILAGNPELTLVRGFYHCPQWGKEQHWWLKDKQGNIIDPTVAQFPTKGVGAEYEEFTGMCECDECGSTFPESAGRFESRYAFCSAKCLHRFVGLGG